MSISREQCKMARAGLGLSVRDLAKLAEVSPNTVARFERGERLQPRTAATIRAALERSGAVFIDPNGGGPGVRLNRE